MEKTLFIGRRLIPHCSQTEAGPVGTSRVLLSVPLFVFPFFFLSAHARGGRGDRPPLSWFSPGGLLHIVYLTSDEQKSADGDKVAAWRLCSILIFSPDACAGRLAQPILNLMNNIQPFSHIARFVWFRGQRGLCPQVRQFCFIHSSLPHANSRRRGMKTPAQTRAMVRAAKEKFVYRSISW